MILIVNLGFTFSALVGFGLMVIMTPAPAYIGQLMASIQEDKMTSVSLFTNVTFRYAYYFHPPQTDKRVEAVTQSMSRNSRAVLRLLTIRILKGLNVLRMLKLFAWEAYMLKELAQRRLEELKQMRKGMLAEIVMSAVTTSLPLIAKVTTFSMYVCMLIYVKYVVLVRKAPFHRHL